MLVVPPMIVEVVLSWPARGEVNCEERSMSATKGCGHANASLPEAEKASDVHHDIVQPPGFEGGAMNTLMERHKVE